MVFFGEEAFSDVEQGFLSVPARQFALNMIVHTWSRYRKTIKRQRASINKIQGEIKDMEASALSCSNAP